MKSKKCVKEYDVVTCCLRLITIWTLWIMTGLRDHAFAVCTVNTKQHQQKVFRKVGLVIYNKRNACINSSFKT